MKTVSKKLISLLLVAIMLVAAMPVFAFADEVTVDNATVVAVCNGAQVGKGTIAQLSNFDVTNKDHLKNAMAFCNPAVPFNETDYEIVSGNIEGTTLTVTLKIADTHTDNFVVTGPGDAAGHTVKCSTVGCTETKVVGHDASGESKQSVDAVAATCDKDGKTAAVVYACGYTVGGKTIPATGHSFQWDGVKGAADGHTLKCVNAGCTETKTEPHTFGTNGKCTVCGYEKPAEPTPTEHKHNYAVDASATTETTHTLKCDVAGCTEPTKTEAHKFDSNGKCTVCGYQKAVTPATPTYTVIVKVEGKKDQTFTKVAYDGTLKADNAQAILNKAGCTDQVSDYNNLSFTNDNGTITISLSGKKNVSNPDKVTVTVVNGSETKTYELEVGKYYYDYDFFTFANQDGRKFAALKITDTAGYERILDKDVKNDSAKVRSNDAKVTVQWNADTRKIEFMTDSTLSKVGTTRDVYYGARLDSVGGTLPTTVGGKTVEYWTVWGSRIYDNTEYKWNADKVQAVPHFAGESGKVYLEIYANGNRTSKYTQIDITYLLQDGVIYRDRLTSAIESAVKTKNVKITGLFEEGDWSAYVRNVNNVTSKTSVQIGTNNADARYLYVMVNGVSTKTTDSTNPKTGDTAKLGVAAAVLAVAVVGFGAVTVINKKKGVQ